MSCHFRSFLSFLGFCFIVTRRLVRSLFYRHPWLFFCNEFLHSFTFCWSVALLSLMTVKTSSSVERALISSSPSLQQLRNKKKNICFYIFRFLCFSTVPGNWSSWSPWSPCSETCGNGTSTRSRACDNPAPAYGGADCVGAADMSKYCLEQVCTGQLD